MAVDDVVRLDAVRKVYGNSRTGVVALDSVSIGFRRHTFTAVMGPSGSGKSTCLHCAAGLDTPTSGSVTLDGREITKLGERELTILRRERIGFVFQAFNLLPALTVVENIALPVRLAGRRPRRGAVDTVLEQVGLSERRKHRPGELSGGQQQRVAIARALITQPSVIFGDEPTGALDAYTALEILDLLRQAVRSGGQTVVIVTHDPVVAAHADRVVFLAGGRFVGEILEPTAQVLAEQMIKLGTQGRTPAGQVS
ncbi:ABC transporter [Protofrankia sp. BMG5.30]|uniref:ABC transporter n=1 Tax=Protofrankia coriariae TaxID=1562887 RepID=A0ABR5F6J9_9ACTN|nr:ABC transporter [Protofrankia coriariae]ONH37585.1 ABC transporter [Protofrankia sp. BMG5.30]